MTEAPAAEAPAMTEAPAAEAPANINIILATTTSTQDSGLLDILVPLFQEQTGYVVQTIAVGTGEALKMGEEGNADVMLVHAPSSEVAFMEGGFGKDRMLVMHNDFILVGPADDPAKIKGLATGDAFKAISAAGANFITRGDDSGTHKKELALWKGAEPSKPFLPRAQTLSRAAMILAHTKKNSHCGRAQNLTPLVRLGISRQVRAWALP